MGNLSENRALLSPDIGALLETCPFLRTMLAEVLGQGLPYIVMGEVALLIRQASLPKPQLQQLFDGLSDWAAREGSDLDLLGAGTLEMLNDDPVTARLARQGLRGPALDILEALRTGWGQPDFS
jgi:hypothetical protein